MRASFIALTCLLVGGCSAGTRSPARLQPASVSELGFDRSGYVKQRTEFLVQSGVIKDRTAAESKARSDADDRFGSSSR